ncbi:hypothetical protein LJB88_05115, partial [Erysipelotrichaceae bacterium OttesenSCG-928-M19]|nr:hypothetical protein [Erysipelotrichaceae bacterium OttesenSCG-928-M19]
NDDSIWKFSISVPKLKYGSKFVKENSTIKVSYLIDAFQSYQGIEGLTPSPTSVVNNSDGTTTLNWDIKAPSYEEQSQQDKNFFEQNFEVKLKVKPTTPTYTQLTNKVTSEVLFFDNDVLTSNDLTAKVAVTVQDPKLIVSNGDTWGISSKGPRDSFGGVSGSNNLDITVYDGALLGFGVTPTMAMMDSGVNGPTNYEIYYHVDDHLYLDMFHSGNFFYSPNNKVTPDKLPLKTPVIYDVYVKYGYDNNKDANYSLLFSNVKQGEWYRNLNTTGKHISEIKIVFQANEESFDGPKTVPAGMFGRNMNFYFTVEKGYIGKVANQITDIVLGSGKDRYENERMQYGGATGLRWTPDWKLYWGPHTANIVPTPVGETKIGIGSIKFDDVNGNILSPGNNKILVEVKNDKASLENIEGPITAYSLLPIGVSLTNNQDIQEQIKITSISKNYKNSQRELIKIEWDALKLKPGFILAAEINVNVSTNLLASIELTLDVFLNTQDFNVPTITGMPLISDSYKNKDINDFNNNKDTNEYVLSTGNKYISSCQDILEVALSGKGDFDSSYTTAVNASPDSKVNYKLELKNTTNSKLSNLIIINTFPTIDDKTITTNEARDSQFEMKLTGPIKLNADWKNKVTVLYSTTATPKVAGLLDKNTKYLSDDFPLVDAENAKLATWLKAEDVKDWSKIKAYKIESKENIEWLQGKGATVTYSLKTPKTNIIETSQLSQKITQPTANNSVAVAANYSHAVEPEHVLVTLKAKPNQDNNHNENSNKQNKKDLATPITGDNQIFLAMILLLIGLGLLYSNHRIENK